MRRKLRTLVLVCVLAAAVSAASAQEAGKKTAPATAEKKIRIELAEEPALVLGSMRITLGQAMEWAVKQNFDMLSVSYEVAMLDTQYSQFLKKFAPQLIVEGSGAYSRNTPSQRLMAGETVTQAKVDAKIAKNFMSGTTIVGGVNYEYDDFNGRNSIFGGMSGPANAHKPGVFVMVQQELLKNAFGITDRQVQEIIKNESKKKKDIILFQLSLIIVQVVGEYWNTVMSKVSLENAELQVKETRKVRDITARNAAYGLADDYTLRLYNSMLAGAEKNRNRLAFHHDEVESHCHGDKCEQHEEKLALLQQIGPAGLVNDLCDFEHGHVGFFLFNHEELEQADAQGTAYNERTIEKKLPCGYGYAEQCIAAGMQIRNRKIRFTGENLGRQRQD